MVKKLTFYPTIGSCWILDRLVGHIFPFKIYSLLAKFRVEMDEISQKYRNPNKTFAVFFRKN